MSVWDDSWGACDARGVRGDRGTMEPPNVRGPEVSHHLRATCRTTPWLDGRSGPMPTIVAGSEPCKYCAPTVTGSLPTVIRSVDVNP